MKPVLQQKSPPAARAPQTPTVHCWCDRPKNHIGTLASLPASLCTASNVMIQLDFYLKYEKLLFPRCFLKGKKATILIFDIFKVSKHTCFGLGEGQGRVILFSVLIFKYLIILYCPIISAPPKGPRIFCLSLHPVPRWGTRGSGMDKPVKIPPFSIHFLFSNQGSNLSVYIYIFFSFLIPQCCKYHQRGYGRVLCFVLFFFFNLLQM